MTELDRPSVIVPDNTHEQLGVLEQRNKLLAWTKNTPELFVMFGEAKGKRYKKRTRLEGETEISNIINSSITKSVDQYRMGLELGFFLPYQGMSTELLKVNTSQEAETLFKTLEGIDYYIDASLALMVTSIDEIPEADEFAGDYWKIFTTFPSNNGNSKNSLPLGYITAEERHGVPIIYCEKKEDLKSLLPVNISEVEWPENIQALSFVVTENTPPYVGTDSESKKVKDNVMGSLWVVSIADCPSSVIDKHINSQLSFASSVNRDTSTPIFLSREELADQIDKKSISVEGAIDLLVKDITLEYLVTDKVAHPNMWEHGHRNRNVREYNTSRSLFLNNERGDFKKIVKPKDKEKAQLLFSRKLSEAFDVVQKLVVNRFPDNKLGHLIIANSLSHYQLSDWVGVAEVIRRQSLKNSRIKELSILKK